MLFTVTWEIEIEADNAEQAARRAKEIQLDRDSIANVFKIDGKTTVYVSNARTKNRS